MRNCELQNFFFYQKMFTIFAQIVLNVYILAKFSVSGYNEPDQYRVDVNIFKYITSQDKNLQAFFLRKPILPSHTFILDKTML